MKITRIIQETYYTFLVEKDTKEYNVKIWMHPTKSKFIDWEIFDLNRNRVDSELEDEIINQIDDNWNNLVTT